MTLRDQVYNELRNMILINEFPAGTRLNETEVAKRLGVSPTPVREALNKLRGDGLVSSDPHQGCYVRVFSDADIENILEIRCALEILALEQAFPKLAEEDMANLENVQASYAVEYSTSPPNYKGAAAWNLAFHDFLVEKSGNRWLREMLDTVNTYSALARAPITRTSDGRTSINEHNQILAALKARNLEEARRGIRRHIERIRQDLLQARRSQLSRSEEG